MSAVRGRAWPPARVISLAVARTSGSVWERQPTLAPSRAKRRAAALPMPEPAPVTRATLSVSCMPRILVGARAGWERGIRDLLLAAARFELDVGHFQALSGLGVEVDFGGR